MTPPPNRYDFLKAEARSPYRGLRRVFYVTFGLSGLMGAIIAFLRLLAQRGQVGDNAENLLIQIVVTAVMINLWRLDRETKT